MLVQLATLQSVSGGRSSSASSCAAWDTGPPPPGPCSAGSAAPTLDLAFELGWDTGKLSLTTGAAQRPRLFTTVADLLTAA